LNGPDVPGAYETLPGLPGDTGGPVFAEPWQAQAVALAVALNEQGAFTWSEWAQALSRELARDGDSGDDGTRYYHHWVAALEALIGQRGLVDAAVLATRKADWAEAYRLTPHGAPVLLAARD
jgi:nitrile hydratase accessory protein